MKGLSDPLFCSWLQDQIGDEWSLFLMQDKEEKPVLVVLPAEVVQDRSQLVPEVGSIRWPAHPLLAWLSALQP